jgi:uncharacterized repeat protein (TIGR01451 family)
VGTADPSSQDAASESSAEAPTYGDSPLDAPWPTAAAGAGDATLETPPLDASPSQAVPDDLLEATPVPSVVVPAPVEGPVASQSTASLPVAAVAAAADAPGPVDLEGQQFPSLAIEKTAPAEIQVGKVAAFQTVVRNVGQTTAHEVVVTDRVPQGTRLENVSPQPTQTADGALAWQLGSLAPGDEVVITMELMPESEGEIGSVAQVTFHAQASVRTVCTRAQLTVEHTAPRQVMIGEDVVLEITISNAGTGAATGVVLEEDVPQGLVHPAGGELEYGVGTLRPGETRQLDLILSAESAGVVTNSLRVRGEGGLIAEHSLELEVVAPQLQVALAGPSRRYLERQVTYEIGVSNPGTAAARDVDLVAYLPQGLQFIAADQQGQYDRQNHAVYWSLEELGPQQQGVVQLTALPIETGDQKIRVEGQADMGLSHEFEHTTVVEGIIQLQFTVSDVQDPIEVGADTIYEIRVVNNGTKTATNVVLTANLPAGLTPLEGEGPTAVTVSGQQVVTEPLAQLAAGGDAVYRVHARGVQAGDHVFGAQLVSDDSSTPVTKQESTRVYIDE